MVNQDYTHKWDGRSILVVEDDESSAYLFGEILKGTGIHVSFATNGEDAVRFIEAHPDTDLVLMDVHLPVKDGFTATKEIKALSSTVRVIAQTAYAFSVDQHEARRAGCDALVNKPINRSVLLDKLTTLLD
ncbi:MAG: response regulator [Bacteroidales bacterium]